MVATVLATEGHTYKKEGARAVYTENSTFPVMGNLGTGCYDAEIRRVREEVLETGTPETLEMNTDDVMDVHFGSGTGCGGRIEVLVEPVLSEQKQTYRAILEELENQRTVRVGHNRRTGELRILDEDPGDAPDLYVEEISPPTALFLFGATPLARRIIHVLQGMNYAFHVVDWRKVFRTQFPSDDVVHIRESFPDELPDRNAVLLLSHQYEREKEKLRKLSEMNTGYVGMLSSTDRRDRIMKELIEEGVDEEFLRDVHSPAGVDIQPETDPEIAVSIAAELVEHR